MNIFEWIKNKKELEEQMEKDDRLIDNQRSEISKCLKRIEEKEKELSISLSNLEKEILKSKKQQKQIRELKKKLKEYEK